MSNNMERVAAARVDARLGFYSHAVIYAAVIGLLWLINATGTSEHWWAIWPTAGWGIGLAMHGARTFLAPTENAGESLRQRMIRAEVNRLNDSSEPTTNAS